MKTLKPTLFLLSFLAFSSLSSFNAHALKAECAPNEKVDQSSPIFVTNSSRLAPHSQRNRLKECLENASAIITNPNGDLGLTTN